MNLLIYALYNSYHKPLLSALNEKIRFGHCVVIGNNESNQIPWSFGGTCETYDWRKILIDFEEADWSQIAPLTADLIEAMRPCETAVYRMMDRNSEDCLNAWSYDLRKQVYYRHLRYWNHVIEDREIDLFISMNIPHETIDFIIFHICKARQIPTFFFYQFQPDICFLMSDWRQMVEPRIHGGPHWSRELSGPLQKEWDSRRGNGALPTPFYMQQSRRTFFESLTSHLMGILKATLELSTQIGRLKKRRRRARHRYIATLAKELNSVECAFNPTTKYVYFPLHLQPELSTSPLAGPYVEQLLIAKMLSATLPADTLIYVKEHPLQDLAKRTPGFYNELANLQNVKIIERRTRSADLMRNAIAVATATGTAGWEAIFQHKPVLLFGDTFYTDAPGVRKINSNDDLKAAIEAMTNSTAPLQNESELHSYLKWLDTQYVFGNIDIEYQHVSTLDREENLSNLAIALTKKVSEALRI